MPSEHTADAGCNVDGDLNDLILASNARPNVFNPTLGNILPPPTHSAAKQAAPSSITLRAPTHLELP
jgi:hypothetical protein